MKGPTIRFVITRVCFTVGIFIRFRQNPRGQILFCHTGKLAIVRFHNIGILL